MFISRYDKDAFPFCCSMIGSLTLSSLSSVEKQEFGSRRGDGDCGRMGFCSSAVADFPGHWLVLSLFLVSYPELVLIGRCNPTASFF